MAKKEKEPEIPVWTLDPNQCYYCFEGIWPHEHQPEEPPQRARKAGKASARKPKAEKPPKVSNGRRGRPMKPENAALLRECEGHAEDR